MQIVLEKRNEQLRQMSNKQDLEYMNKWCNKIRAATGYMHDPGPLTHLQLI